MLELGEGVKDISWLIEVVVGGVCRVKDEVVVSGIIVEGDGSTDVGCIIELEFVI